LSNDVSGDSLHSAVAVWSRRDLGFVNHAGILPEIAPRVVHHRGGVLSRAFARCVGLTPSQYRERRKWR
jgi:AraC-like DNA-binding protein